MSGIGFYIIYNNKNINGYDHFATLHAKFGLAIVIMSVGLGMVGGVVLHPDFGVDKTNKTIRFAHKMGARVVLASAWMCCLSGLYTLTTAPVALGMVGVPLLLLFPFTLI